MPSHSWKNIVAPLLVMRRANGGAVSTGKDAVCHHERGVTEVMEQQCSPLNPLQQFLCCGFFFLLLFKSFLWELSEPPHWKREPNSLPEAAETCLQLPSDSHFWNRFISKSSYKPGCIGPQITRWKCEKILDRDEASTKTPNLKAA